ncbi:MAG: sulfurtransferase [Actinobacteria bacterium]|nr:sulfurtransferase [Actinomycetota bacterium]
MSLKKISRVVAFVASIALLSSITAAPSQAIPKNDTQTLVSADWLQKNINDPKIVIIEVSTEDGLYERGHINGAVKVSWHSQLVDPVNRDILSKSAFQKLARSAGIDNDSTVVFYGDNNNWFAAWGAWVFNIYGAQDVRLLNGGRNKWEKDGRPLTTAVSAPALGDIVAKNADKSLRAFLPEVLNVAKKKQKSALVDIRSADEFSGKIFAPAGFQELAIRAGHIPGAINIPWKTAVNSDGTFKNTAEVRKIYADLGIDGKKPIIVYCRIGERASHTWFLLSQVLGYDVKVYDGSWTEYGNSVGSPISNPSGTIWGKA